MIYVERYRTIQSIPPEMLRALLFHPPSLSMLIPRLRNVESGEFQDNILPLALSISFGNLFGSVRLQGYMWQASPHEIIFHIPGRNPSELRWSLVPDQHGTVLRIHVALDLAPILGPMVHFLPRKRIEETIANEIDHAFETIAAYFENPSVPQICPTPHISSFAPHALALAPF